MEKEVVGTFTILNEKGLHARPSAEIVKCTSFFRSQVTLHFKNEYANAKSILDLLALGAVCGSQITIKAIGDDSQEAIDTVIQLSKEQFNLM
jgi:phosphocarrier protein